MPYLSLTLNGYPVDLPADAAVALSYRANDLRNLDGREAAFSESFTLPNTARNRAVLGNPHSLDSLATTPYRLLPAVLTSPGGVVVLNGFAILESSGEGFEVTLTDAIGGLFVQTGDASLRDLNLSAYTHPLSFGATLASQSNDYKQGYAYTVADTGRLATRAPATGLNYTELTLCTYYHAVLSAIIASALPGYRVTGSLLSEKLYQEAVLPQATGYLQLAEAQRAGLSAQGHANAAHLYPANLNNSNAEVVPLQFPAGAANPFFAGLTYAAPAFPIALTVKIKASFRLVGRQQGIGVTVVRVLIRDAGVGQGLSTAGILLTHDVFIGFYNNVPATTQVVDLALTLPWVAAATQLQVQLFYVGADVTLLPGSSAEWTAAARAYPGAPVELAANLPDLKQADFLKLVCNEFNIIVQADPVYKTVRFDLFNDLERNRDRAVDWSGKLDFTRRPRLAYTLGDYAQQNSLHYEEAPDVYATLYTPATEAIGGAQLPVVNATLDRQSEAYAAPVLLPQQRAALGTALLWLPFFEADDEALPAEFYDATKQYNSSQQAPIVYGGTRWKATLNPPSIIQAGQAPTTKPVMVLINTIPVPVVAWAPLEDKVAESELKTTARVAVAPATITAHADSPLTDSFSVARALQRTGLRFDELLPVYYAGFVNMLKRVQVLTLDVRLTALDIANLDFTFPVRFDVPHAQGYGKLSCLAYLNDIDQHIPSEPGAVACTFLVLGTPVAGLAPTVPNPPVRPLRILMTQTGPLLVSEDGFVLLAEI